MINEDFMLIKKAIKIAMLPLFFSFFCAQAKIDDIFTPQKFRLSIGILLASKGCHDFLVKDKKLSGAFWISAGFTCISPELWLKPAQIWLQKTKDEFKDLDELRQTNPEAFKQRVEREAIVVITNAQHQALKYEEKILTKVDSLVRWFKSWSIKQ